MPQLKISKPTDPLMVAPALPSDPALRAIVDDTLKALRYSLAVAASDTQPSARGRADQVFHAFLATRRPLARTQLREQATALLAAPMPLRTTHFGRYAAVDPQVYRSKGSDEMTTLVSKLAVDGAAVRKSVDALRKRLAFAPAGPKISVVEHETVDATGKKVRIKLDPDALAGLAFKKLRLFVRSVKCVEETSEIGSDEINMGGNVTTTAGATTIVQQFEVSDDFDEGEVVNFGTSKVFASWDLATATSGFPYVYGAVIALAEKDDGGFYKFLNDLWALVDDKVTAAVGAAVGAAIGGAIGNVLGAVVGAVVGAIIGWLMSLFGDNPDEILGAQPLILALGSTKKSYYDWAKLTSPDGLPATLHFKADGGHYVVHCAYKVFTA